jgi:hypothetical protein
MTEQEKLKCIKDMGIDIWDGWENCPSQYGLIEYCEGNGCEECWILSLEIKP